MILGSLWLPRAGAVNGYAQTARALAAAAVAFPFGSSSDLSVFPLGNGFFTDVTFRLLVQSFS